MGIALTSEWVDKHNQLVANGRITPVESPRAVAVATRLLVKKSTDEQKLNKLETRYLQHLRSLGHQMVGVQNITLKLADDTRLTPDFYHISSDGSIVFTDVKGFQREDALIKMKVAARSFPWATFQIVSLTNGAWNIREVKP